MRCTVDELAAIEAKAEQAGMLVCDFLRDQVLRGKPPRSIQKPRVDRKRLAMVLAELQDLGPRMNDLARIANAGGGLSQGPELAEITARTKAIRDLLKRALEGGSE